MKIIHISAECYPMAKVGGLADVVGALPKYQQKAGHQASVILPAYATSIIQENSFTEVYTSTVVLGDLKYPFSVVKETTGKLGYDLYLLQIDELFHRNTIYGYDDDTERFLSFQIAALDWLITLKELPTVINCHDHHSGLIPFMMHFSFKYKKLRKIASVITIHNGLYQGQFALNKMHYIPQFDSVYENVLEWDNCINSLAVAVKCANAVTTVSPSYLDEINKYANGLESLFRSVQSKSKGILNGIDTELWNPATDTMIAKNYDSTSFIKGKQANKDALCERFNLDKTKPLFSFIGRLFEEKGGDLLPQVIALAMKENNRELNILILGSGRKDIEQQLKDLVTPYAGNYNTFIGYDENLAHLVYASSDFLIMPSRVEPCGLNQMYSLRYGAVPIVRRTGGLKDTITDFGDNGNGICHEQASVTDICHSIDRAIKLYNRTTDFEKIRIKGMQTDHSWERVCEEYIKTYQTILENEN
ncbi:glycogen synthase [Flavobacterium sp. TMP13]|uniref:glycogen synthase n=1 Tax=Flavobacterium sp. TMP13 TaxID=3425950 RepID=UPI003D7814D7